MPLWECPQFLGDPSEEDPPVPIPNTAVKLLSPDGTARASVWESRTSPGLIQRPPVRRRPFVSHEVLLPAVDQPSKTANELHIVLVQRTLPDLGQILLELFQIPRRHQTNVYRGVCHHEAVAHSGRRQASPLGISARRANARRTARHRQ